MNRKGDKKTLLPPGFNKVKKLGEGVGSVVWSVRHETTREKLALKLATETDPAHRLQREFAILERLDLPGIIKVKDFGEHEGCEYFTMELIEGKPITNFFSERRKGKGFVELFLEVFQRAAAILSGLHHEGIVHIDIKPANLLIKDDGEPMLLDFGFSEDFVLSPTSDVRGTTLAYAAPELFAGGEITPAADIYSLGVITYEILSGAMLGIEKSSQELLSYKLRILPRFGKLDIELPAGLEALIFRMLNPEPGLRPSADEVIAEIEWLSKGEKVEVKTAPMIPRLCFGGRDQETAEIERLVFDEKRIVILIGEQGIGKTRLLRELRFRAILDGRNVLFTEGRDAHLSLVEYVSTILGIEQPKIDPEKEQRPDKWSRYERVFQAIEKAGFDGVFVDAPRDLSQDEAGLLGYLCRGFESKLGFVLSDVPVEVYPEAAKVELDPLDEAEVKRIVFKTFEDLKEKEKLGHTLSSVAEGNPVRMNELLELLHSDGWLTWKRGWVYEPSKDEKGLAAKLEGWLGERVEGLDTDSKETLSLLAAAESALPAEVITKVIGDAAPLVLVGLVNEGYVRTFIYLERPHFEIQNELIRTYVQDRFSNAKKKSPAEKLAESLEVFCMKLWGKNSENWGTHYLVQVGLLYFEAHNNTKASVYLTVAGNRLSREGDLKKGEEILQIVLQCEPKVKERKKALHELGRITGMEGNSNQAIEYFSQILPLVEGNLEEKADIMLRIGQVYDRVRELDKAEVYYKKSEQLVPHPSNFLRHLQFYSRGWNAFFRGKIDEAQVLFEKSLEFAKTSTEHFESRRSLVIAHYQKGDLKKALEHSKIIMRSIKEITEKHKLCQLILVTAEILRRLGRLKEAEESLNEALTMAAGMTYQYIIPDILQSQIKYLYSRGHYRQARDTARQAIEVLTRIGDEKRRTYFQMQEVYQSLQLDEWEPTQHLCLKLWREFIISESKAVFEKYANPLLRYWAAVYRLKGEFQIARRILSTAKRIATSTSGRSKNKFLLATEIDRCELCIDACQFSEAQKLLRECKLLLEKHKEAGLESEVNLLESKISLNQGKCDRALEIVSRLMSDIELQGGEAERGKVLRTLGRILIASGKFNEGLTKLYESLEVFKSRGQTYNQGVTLYAVTEAMFEHGDYSEDAVSALEEAETIFERLGAEHYLKKIEELRDKYSDELAGQAGLSLKYLKGLKKINELINQRLGKEDFMAELLSITLGITGAERGMVFLAEEKKLHSVATQRIDNTTARDAKKISRTIIKQLLHEMQPIYTSDTAKDKRFNRSESILLNKIRSFICVPLKTGERIIGTIYLDSRKKGLFNPGNLVYFETLGNLLAASIDRTAEYNRLQEELALARQRKGLEESDIVIGTSTVMQKVYSQIEKLAKSDTNVLLEGETGTGKGVIARMIHEQSPRREYEFCSINCGVLPENILEAELFGTRKGAYTGATQDRIGLLEAADCSTVFFDEVTNTSPSMQTKLLEVIEEKVIRRIGETKPRKVNLRFIFATNRDLKKEVKAGRFREDLYFRISTLTLTLPPLRDRKEDIPEFVNFFIKKFSKELNKDVKGIDDDALAILLDSSWPGNIRELKSVIERSVLLTSGRYITTDILKQHFPTEVDMAPEAELKTDVPKAEDVLNLESAKARVEEQIIRQALSSYKTLEEAAKALGISKRSLCRKKKLLGL